MASTHILSKSTFMRSVQCQKSLYLNKHFPKLKDPVSTSQQALFDRGTDIGLLAQSLFPNGVDCSPPTYFQYDISVAKTAQLIKDGAKVIYEASFQSKDGILVALDILVFENNQWKAYEVKSSTEVKEQHIMDASLQYHVINQFINLEDISIININNQYIKNGDIDIQQLFKIESIIDLAKANQKLIEQNIAIAKTTLKQQDIPAIDIGVHCDNPYPCDFKNHCWKHIPPNSIFDIARLKAYKKFELYNAGIIELKDVPEDFKLTENQRLQVDCHNSNTTQINIEPIKDFITNLNYPLHFLDFETFNPAIPLFNQSRPYQAIPFQYSLHLRETKDSEVKHFEFLGEAGLDPRIRFIEQLIKDLGDTGDILVYNESFEIARMKEIAVDFPIYVDRISAILLRIKDLMEIFQKKWYYSSSMHGSYSIKSVLPALVPELSYNDLGIGDGSSASTAYEQLANEMDLFKVAEIRGNLLDYCRLDTWAMVSILNFLQEL